MIMMEVFQHPVVNLNMSPTCITQTWNWCAFSPRHIILTLSQHVFALTSFLSCGLGKEAANKNFIVFDWGFITHSM